MERPTVLHAVTLDAVRLRRAELRESIARTEAALAARDVPHHWGVAVHAALSDLADDYAAHIEVTEGPGGLHEAIVAGDLRLTNAVDGLTAEHRSLAAALAELLVDTEPPLSAARHDDVRDRGRAMLHLLVRHRQRGADLVHEAFATDLGGGD